MFTYSILSRVSQEYRRERWWSLLTSVLTTALRSAYLLASVQDYITLSLEMLAQEICRSNETKTRIQVDLLNVICVSATKFYVNTIAHYLKLNQLVRQLIS